MGLELRGGTLNGVRIAAATLNPLIGNADHAGQDHERSARARRQARRPISTSNRCRRWSLRRIPRFASRPIRRAPPPKAIAPVVLNGRIDPPGENDRFVIATTPGQRMRIRVEASEFGSALDGVLQVLGKNGSVIANADDTNIPQPARNGQQAQALVTPDPVARSDDSRRYE